MTFSHIHDLNYQQLIDVTNFSQSPYDSLSVPYYQTDPTYVPHLRYRSDIC